MTCFVEDTIKTVKGSDGMLKQITESTYIALKFKRNDAIKNQIMVRVLLLRGYHIFTLGVLSSTFPLLLTAVNLGVWESEGSEQSSGFSGANIKINLFLQA